MKKLILFTAIAGIMTAGLTGCTKDIDKEYVMNIIEIVEADDGNHLAYCEPAKVFNLKHYVDIPELESYEGIETFIAKQGKEKEYFLVNTKKVNDGKYKFERWEK